MRLLVSQPLTSSSRADKIRSRPQSKSWSNSVLDLVRAATINLAAAVTYDSQITTFWAGYGPRAIPRSMEWNGMTGMNDRTNEEMDDAGPASRFRHGLASGSTAATSYNADHAKHRSTTSTGISVWTCERQHTRHVCRPAMQSFQTTSWIQSPATTASGLATGAVHGRAQHRQEYKQRRYSGCFQQLRRACGTNIAVSGNVPISVGTGVVSLQSASAHLDSSYLTTGQQQWHGSYHNGCPLVVRRCCHDDGRYFGTTMDGDRPSAASHSPGATISPNECCFRTRRGAVDGNAWRRRHVKCPFRRPLSTTITAANAANSTTITMVVE